MDFGKNSKNSMQVDKNSMKVDIKLRKIAKSLWKMANVQKEDKHSK